MTGGGRATPATGATATGRVATAAVCAGVSAGLARRWSARRPPGGEARWRRTNHAGAPVSLLEGPAWVLGATLGTVSGSTIGNTVGRTCGRVAAAARATRGGAGGPAVAALAAGVVGALDDLAGDSRRKGLAGHLAALARGEVTTGAVKVLGLAAGGVGAAALTGAPSRRGGPGGVLGVLADGALVAGTANLVNLLDLRPGRALKVVLLVAGPLAAGGSVPAAAAAGASLALLPGDLAGETMLGDTGANAAGALLGAAVLERLGTRGRLGVLAAVTAATLASERVSFTRVIESTPVLRELDALGRRATPVAR